MKKAMRITARKIKAYVAKLANHVRDQLIAFWRQHLKRMDEDDLYRETINLAAEIVISRFKLPVILAAIVRTTLAAIRPVQGGSEWV